MANITFDEAMQAIRENKEVIVEIPDGLNSIEHLSDIDFYMLLDVAARREWPIYVGEPQ